MLDVDMCAYNLLVVLAQPSAIELSTFNPQEIDYNNCLGKHIHFQALSAPVSLIVKTRHKNIWLVTLI